MMKITRLPPKQSFLIIHEFHTPCEIPVGKEDMTDILVVLSTDILNEELLSDGYTTIETNLQCTLVLNFHKCKLHMNCPQKVFFFLLFFFKKTASKGETSMRRVVVSPS